MRAKFSSFGCSANIGNVLYDVVNITDPSKLADYDEDDLAIPLGWSAILEVTRTDTMSPIALSVTQ